MADIVERFTQPGDMILGIDIDPACIETTANRLGVRISEEG